MMYVAPDGAGIFARIFFSISDSGPVNSGIAFGWAISVFSTSMTCSNLNARSFTSMVDIVGCAADCSSASCNVVFGSSKPLNFLISVSLFFNSSAFFGISGPKPIAE